MQAILYAIRSVFDPKIEATFSFEISVVFKTVYTGLYPRSQLIITTVVRTLYPTILHAFIIMIIRPKEMLVSSSTSTNVYLVVNFWNLVLTLFSQHVPDIERSADFKPPSLNPALYDSIIHIQQPAKSRFSIFGKRDG
jgi:hypothetical protein